jgi:flagellar basal-body rod modification protein FlgD
MDIQQVNAVEQLFPTANTRAANSDSGELGQEQFLKLLVAQLEHQDPSQPVENGEFLSQIAQFSMVSGIGNVEDGVTSLAATMQRSQVADAAALLQRQVLFDGSSVELREGAALPTGQLALQESATNVRLRVMDARGATVAVQNLGMRTPADGMFAWDGRTLDGKTAPAGRYHLEATGFIDGVEQSLPMRVYGQVESVSVDPVTRGLSLQLEDGARLSLSDVLEFK